MNTLFSPQDLQSVDPGAPSPTPSSGLFTPDLMTMASPETAPPVEKATPPSPADRFETGLMDLPTGLGQIAEHVVATPLNAVRSVIRSGLNAVGANRAADLFDPVSAQGFDRIVQRREQEYQSARSAAGQGGVDWWRLAGQVADPLNYLMPGDAAATVAGRLGQAAAQGGAVSAAQPTSTPGSFWWDKAKNTAEGGILGGAASGLIEAAAPALRAGLSAARKAVGDSPLPEGTGETLVHEALRSQKVDPQTVDLNVLAGLKQEVQDAIAHGSAPSEAAIANRALANSLPVPIPLLRGQATGDPMQFAREQYLRGITGVGEPITHLLQTQNAGFIHNLDALGAKDAPDPVSFGLDASTKIQKFWDGLQARKNALYDAVKTHEGQSASMDGVTAADQIHAALDTPEMSHAYDLLPANIQRTIDDLQSGKVPFSVAQMQSLDKMWGMAARGTDGSTAHAINVARDLINNAPIKDDLGGEAKMAYQAARQAHAQQMGLIDPDLPNGTPNPSFQPLVKSVVLDGKPPESLFQQHFMGAKPSVAAKNLSFLKSIDPNAPEAVGRTLMGEIKRKALSSASEERGTVSEPIIRGWAKDPVKSALMETLLPHAQVSTFRNLARVIESAKKIPVGAAVNASNTASALVNMGASMLKRSALGQISQKIPVLHGILEGLNTAKLNTEVNAAVNPGVTLKSLLSATPEQAEKQRLLSTLTVPAVTSEESSRGQ